MVSAPAPAPARPVPPYSRVVEESACENCWNRRSWACAAIPMPESMTRQIAQWRPHMLQRIQVAPMTALLNFTKVYLRPTVIDGSAVYASDRSNIR